MTATISIYPRAVRCVRAADAFNRSDLRPARSDGLFPVRNFYDGGFVCALARYFGDKACLNANVVCSRHIDRSIYMMERVDWPRGQKRTNYCFSGVHVYREIADSRLMF